MTELVRDSWQDARNAIARRTYLCRYCAGAGSADYYLGSTKIDTPAPSACGTMTPSMMLTVVPEHLVTAEGAVAKPDVAHPKLAHSERSELVGPIAESDATSRIGFLI